MAPAVTRRSFLGGAVTLVCAPPMLSTLGCAAATPAPTVVDGWTVPPGTKLGAPQYATLLAAMDAMVPLAVEANAAWYLDQLLGAFDVDPPRIYAGGPYSGRQGGEDNFSSFLPLTRVEALRWRTYLEGSKGLPEREWNGPVQGLAQRYQAGLDALERAAQQKGGAFTRLTRDARRVVLLAADVAFVDVLYAHTVEGTYGDPVYGGNREHRAWAAIGYEGDRHPLGYTERQMTHPEEG